jgi:hypothetical protein
MTTTTTTAVSQPRNFETKEYCIRSIQVIDNGSGCRLLFPRGEQTSQGPVRLRFGKAFRLRVDYECLMPELPEVSCGVAAAFTRVKDMEPIMYFNTNYPHSDEEFLNYDRVEFRKYIGRTGRVEAYVEKLQASPDDYLLTVGILPNRPGHHAFYELHYLCYPVVVEPDGCEIKGIFAPHFSVAHDVLDNGE